MDGGKCSESPSFVSVDGKEIQDHINVKTKLYPGNNIIIFGKTIIVEPEELKISSCPPRNSSLANYLFDVRIASASDVNNFLAQQRE